MIAYHAMVRIGGVNNATRVGVMGLGGSVGSVPASPPRVARRCSAPITVRHPTIGSQFRASTALSPPPKSSLGQIWTS